MSLEIFSNKAAGPERLKKKFQKTMILAFELMVHWYNHTAGQKTFIKSRPKSWTFLNFLAHYEPLVALVHSTIFPFFSLTENIHIVKEPP